MNYDQPGSLVIKCVYLTLYARLSPSPRAQPRLCRAYLISVRSARCPPALPEQLLELRLSGFQLLHDAFAGLFHARRDSQASERGSCCRIERCEAAGRDTEFLETPSEDLPVCVLLRR